MLIRLILIVLLYLCCQLTGRNVCPHERTLTDGKKFIGTRKDENSCMTFRLVDWSVWNLMDLYDSLNDGPCREFKNGGTVTAFSPEDFKLGGDWQNDVTLDYLLMGFYTSNFQVKIKSSRVFWDDIHMEWAITYYDENRQMHKKVNGFWTTNYWPGTETLNDVSGAPEYVRHLGFKTVKQWRETLTGQFNYERGCTCPSVYVKDGKITRNHIHPCLHLAHYHLITYYRCVHDAYNDCRMKVISECHYVESVGKSYDRYMVVDQKADPPYGKPCANWTYEEIGAKICESNCTGTWGQWNGEPTVICDTYSVVRYRPPRGSTPCFAQSHQCCMEMKTVNTGVPCENFAYNTTINLEIEKCLNGGKLGRDKIGHLMCQCLSNFKGIRCETNMCTIECKNGGTCSMINGEALCLCQPGFSGSLCETPIKLCDNTNKCHNGGTCISLVSEKRAYCKCAPGFAGPSCQQSFSFCTMDSCNFHGACYNLTEYFSFKCRCYDGFTGERCENLIKTVKSDGLKHLKSTGFVSAIFLLLGILVLCMGGSTITYRHHRRRRRRRRLRKGSECQSFSSTTQNEPQSTLARIKKSFMSKKVRHSFTNDLTKKTAKSSTAPPKSRRVRYM